MDIARYSIEKSAVTWVTVVLLIFGGIFSFYDLGRLEDPKFTIKDAVIFTTYHGANALEVEQEVTDKIEIAVQKIAEVDYVTSKSYPGFSEVTVTIKTKYDGTELPQIWDELRRKINDVQHDLPPGVETSIVNDDFGQVYGIFYGITGDDYSNSELREVAKIIRQELLLIDEVARVSMRGEQQEQIFIEVSASKIGQLGMAPQEFFSTISSQNLISSAGEVKVDEDSIRIMPTGEFDSVEDIGELLVGKGGSKELIRLKDIANIYRGYDETPLHIISLNGKPAITLAVAPEEGINVINLGDVIEARINEIQQQLPAGIEILKIYHQPTYVKEAINGFLISFAQAITIVIAVLLLTMGIRSGIIISSVLLLNIFGTFIFMDIFSINLHRISLGALVISLGMLVDNAIVVAEGILVEVQEGKEPKQAASATVNRLKWPLFAATVVAIIAFAPIGLSDDATGEYTASLFYVILIAMALSWYLAVTVTPLFCYHFLPQKGVKVKTDEEVYSNEIFKKYNRLLNRAIKYRWLTVIIMLLLLGISIIGFGMVKQSFFPYSNTPIFYIDYWRSQGTDIREVKKDLDKIEKYLMQLDGVTQVATFTGAGASRFMLTYTSENPNPSYGHFIVRVQESEQVQPVAEQILSHIKENFYDADSKTKFMLLGPGKDAKIEVRISGDDPTVLRKLANETKEIMLQTGDAINVKQDWRQKVKVLRPDFSEDKARLTGITRSDVKNALKTAFSGWQVGMYRDGDELLPIIVTLPKEERNNISTVNNLTVWSKVYNSPVPMLQLVDKFETVWEDEIIKRRDRVRTITASCDPKTMTPHEFFHLIKPQVEALDLPTGYKIEWGGEYESSKNAKDGLWRHLPIGLLLMVLTVIVLFGKIRQPLIIWLTVPLAFIGVTIGLLLTGQSFGFMALLGFLSLSGMIINNSIVFIDKTDQEIEEGRDPMQAVKHSAISRMRPVTLSALTTVMGMIPLLKDIFFVSMAVTIMSGLAFGTLLTLVVLPVLYTIFFKIK